MARGNQAKTEVIEKIIETFGRDNTILYDKKLYITTKEDGAPIQVCLTLTCPKTLVSPSGAAAPAEPPKSAFGGGFDFESMGATTAEPEPFKPAEITQAERDNVRELMARLGL